MERNTHIPQDQAPTGNLHNLGNFESRELKVARLMKILIKFYINFKKN